ncbi:MAG: ABC transporter substrate-binding protein [Sphingobacteriia bacterium]|nr:ABC transporter substrate-binding protein [Sphingobacteriia bacterium]NCC39210.1 ABC transporter substrate-binding protein [Gammaproteobacteria bacterium]
MSFRLTLLIICLLLGAGAAQGAPTLSVFVSIPPQATFVTRIGGADVQVQALIQPGQDPHAFEPTARQIAALAEADLYVRSGMPFEDAWLPRLQAASPSMRVLDPRDGVDLRAQDGGHDRHGHDHEGHEHHGHGDWDPHLWTSPARVKIMGAAIRDALVALDPAHAESFMAGFERFAADLDVLDAEIRARLAGVRSRRFLIHHPAWGYFADDYGLEQVAIERAGKEPGARALSGLIEQARREQIRVVFAQPQINPVAAEQVAAAIGGRVAVIDPLASDYFENLLRVADLIAGANAP